MAGPKSSPFYGIHRSVDRGYQDPWYEHEARYPAGPVPLPKWDGKSVTTKLEFTHPIVERIHVATRHVVSEAALAYGDVQATLRTINNNLTREVILELQVQADLCGTQEAHDARRDRLDEEAMMLTMRKEVAETELLTKRVAMIAAQELAGAAAFCLAVWALRKPKRRRK